MKIDLELRSGSSNSGFLCKADVQKNIDAIDRVMAKASISDHILLFDTRTILISIQSKLRG